MIRAVLLKKIRNQWLNVNKNKFLETIIKKKNIKGILVILMEVVHCSQVLLITQGKTVKV